ncbi:MAG TPA: ATP-binding cassette domain-containing protein [Burkholderiales bacterium]|nr:ATP-binding cassette domain-containing protein [Burkholderiales bacterium]
MISIRELTRRFGGVRAVDALTLEVGSGEVFGLVGRNGAGKTTTIKMLTTLLPPSSGTASIASFDVVAQAAEVRRVIGYVPQALSADGELTGYENLLVFAKLFDIPRAERRGRIAEALRFMDLEEAAPRLVRGYSGGMIRRLEIAQSTLHRPKVLFLDEPTVGLDPLARQAVWRHIRRLNSDLGTTVVVTTHYMDEAEAICGRIAILHAGRLAACDSPEALKAATGPGATLDEAFARFTGSTPEHDASYADVSTTRRTAQRLG